EDGRIPRYRDVATDAPHENAAWLSVKGRLLGWQAQTNGSVLVGTSARTRRQHGARIVCQQRRSAGPLTSLSLTGTVDEQIRIEDVVGDHIFVQCDLER